MCDRKRFVFPSVGRPSEVGYVFDRERFEFRDKGIDNPCAYFLTYGDGLCQHSHESGVGIEAAVDYLVSLVVHLKEHPDDWAIVARRWPSRPRADLIEFFGKLRYDEHKRRWYSRGERKVSAAESKDHDKRWERIPSYADGSFDAIMRLLAESDRSLTSLEFLAYALAVSETVHDYVNERVILKWLDWHLSDSDGSLLLQSFRAVSACVAMVNGRCEANSHLDSVIWNVERRKEAAA